MPYSALPFPSNLPLESLKVLASDTVIYVGTTGDDANGNGTIANPYKTLSKGMDVARQYVITGNATLTVRLLKGEYAITDNIDLYHPQGNNVIIEGDPAAFRQRTVFNVDSYNWNPASFAGGGHTGSIRVFDGATTTASGISAHGFTSTDHLTYFAISNAALGSRSGYETNGASGGFGIYGPTFSSYDPLFWGDRFFNHGFSYEDGEAILGIGRILGATAEGRLTVEFKNLNWDPRAPSWHTDGGLGNVQRWGGIASNYPETQYSQPVGYYGQSAWKNESGNISYPSKGAEQYITTDPYILSTFPVVIRAPYTSNTGALYLKNGSIRAIRNIMFVNDSAPHIWGSSGLSGATLNWSQGLAAINASEDWRYTSNGAGLILENASAGIRHLGFMGMGTAISLFNSSLTKYTSRTIDPMGSGVVSTSQNGTKVYATPGSLDNAPILNVNFCKRGIVANSSNICLTDSSGINREYTTDYSDGNIYIAAGKQGVVLVNSDMRATTVNVESYQELPLFYMSAVLPVFAGTTLAGASAAFHHNQNTPALWENYPFMAVRMDSNAGGQTLAYLYYYQNDSSAIQNLSGSTATALYTSPGSVAPSEYRKMHFYGVKIAPGGLSFMDDADIGNGLTLGGGTLGIYAFRDTAGTSLAASYMVSNNNILLRGANGYTFAVLGVTSNGHKFVQDANSWGGREWRTSSNDSSAFAIRDASNCFIDKALVVKNCGTGAVNVYENSSLTIGNSLVNDNPSTVTSAQNGEMGGEYPLSNYSTGTLCMSGYWLTGLYAWYGSNVKIGKVFSKNSTLGISSYQPYGTPTIAIRSEMGSSVRLSQMFVLNGPGYTAAVGAGSETSATATVGLFRSRTNRAYGFVGQSTSRSTFPTVYTNRNSQFLLTNSGPAPGPSADRGGGASVFHWDGGHPNMNAGVSGYPRNYAIFGVDTGSRAIINGVNLVTTTTTDTTFSGTRYTVDTRNATNQKINTRGASQGTVGQIYNTSLSGPRYWIAPNQSGANGVQGSNGVNIGTLAESWATDGVLDSDYGLGIYYPVYIGTDSRILPW